MGSPVKALLESTQLAPQKTPLLRIAGLTPRTQSSATAFLQHFFDDIATDQDVTDKVLKRCAA